MLILQMHILVLVKLFLIPKQSPILAKSPGKFSGLTRGVNFNYDQRVILDAGQNDSNGTSTISLMLVTE